MKLLLRLRSLVIAIGIVLSLVHGWAGLLIGLLTLAALAPRSRRVGCLAVFKPAGKTITREHLENGFSANDHGAGIAWCHDKKLYVEKGFFTFDAFWAVYKDVQPLNCLIHFRIGTSGGRDKENCHPWKVNENLAIIHNGIISIPFQFKGKNYSDTGVFVNSVLEPMTRHDPEIWKINSIQWVLEEAIGIGNKMIFLDNEGCHAILNEKQGDWNDGSWFSNCTYKYRRAVTVVRGGNDFRGHYMDDDWDGHRYTGQYTGHTKRGSRRGGQQKANARWVETNIPHVYLLDKEYQTAWKNNQTDTTSPSPASSEDQPVNQPSGNEQVAEKTPEQLLAEKIAEIKANGWEEWNVETTVKGS